MTRRSGPAPLFIANSTFGTIHGYIRCRSKIRMARSLICNVPACHSRCGGATALRLCLVGGGRDTLLRAVRASEQFAVSGSGCLLSSVQSSRAAPGDTHAHSDWCRRRLDTVRGLLAHGRQMGQRGTTDRASRLSRHSPWSLLPAPPARQDPLWVTGWNTTATQRTMQASGCGNFSITISTERMPIQAVEFDFC
jgi:hypothetical protein